MPHPASVPLLSIAGSVVSMCNLIGILEKNGIKKKFILLWKSNTGVSYFRSGQYILVSRKRMHGFLWSDMERGITAKLRNRCIKSGGG